MFPSKQNNPRYEKATHLALVLLVGELWNPSQNSAAPAAPDQAALHKLPVLRLQSQLRADHRTRPGRPRRRLRGSRSRRNSDIHAASVPVTPGAPRPGRITAALAGRDRPGAAPAGPGRGRAAAAVCSESVAAPRRLSVTRTDSEQSPAAQMPRSLSDYLQTVASNRSPPTGRD